MTATNTKKTDFVSYFLQVSEIYVSLYTINSQSRSRKDPTARPTLPKPGDNSHRQTGRLKVSDELPRYLSPETSQKLRGSQCPDICFDKKRKNCPSNWAEKKNSGPISAQTLIYWREHNLREQCVLKALFTLVPAAISGMAPRKYGAKIERHAHVSFASQSLPFLQPAILYSSNVLWAPVNENISDSFLGFFFFTPYS